MSGPWAAIKDRLLNHTPQGLFARAVLEDKPGLNGQAQPSASPLDFLPYTEVAAAVPALAKVGADGAGALLADEAGSLKNPWSNLMRVTSGENPLEMSKHNWAKTIQQLGPNVREKNAETIGAQLMDEFRGTSDPSKLINARLAKNGVGVDDLPSLKVERGMDPRLAGYYVPDSNGIYVNANQMGKKVQHPEANFLGTVAHEAQHALDYLNHDYLGSPEILPQRPFTNKGLAWDGLMTPDRMETLLRAANEDYDVYKRLPDLAKHFLDQGESPETLAKLMQNYKPLRSSMGDIYRTAVGNQGFRGNNPYLADLLHTKGHFAPPIGGEMDLAPHHMAIEEASHGNADIHPDWISGPVKEAMSTYKSPMVQVPKAPAAAPPRPAAWAASSPWAAAAAALGAGAYGAKKYLTDKGGQPVAEQKPKDANQGEPDPVANDDGTGFPAALSFLRSYLHR